MLPRLLTAVLAALVCGGEGGQVIGSSVHGSRPTEGSVGVGSAVASSTTDSGKIVRDRRGRCYGGSLSARALCVRARGGSLAEGQGPTDYLSTLQDQSQPWWIDGKKNAKRKPAGSGGALFAADKNKQRRRRKTTARGFGSTSRASTSAPATSFRTGSLATGDEPLSPAGWAALLAFPLALLAGKLQENGGGYGGGVLPRTRPAKAKAKAKAAVKKPAPARPAKNAKKKTPAPKPKPKPKPKPTPVKKVTPLPAAAKRGSRGGGVGGGILASVVGKLIPDNPYVRALGILVLAVLGSGGLHALTTNNLLRAAWPITIVDPWQVLVASAWAINMRATYAAGRLDGRSRASGPRPVRFFTPASWAFAIWAPIFAGEMLFVAFQLMPLPSIRGSWWLSDISPWFAGAMFFQTLWCFSFRPWARNNGLLWLPALLLGGVAVNLGAVHGVLREAWFANDMTILQYVVIHVPLSLHFGWISCAALVNLNGFFSEVAMLSNGFKLGASLFTVLVAAVLGVGITLLREDPIYAAVVAWALWAVGSPAGWDELRGRVDPGAIRAQQGVAKAGAVVAAAAAGSLVGLSLKDAVMGAGGGEYNEDY